MKLSFTILFILFVSCKKAPPTIEKNFSEWDIYFEEKDFDKHFYIFSLAADKNGNIIFTALARNNSDSVKSTRVLKLDKNTTAISEIDSIDLAFDEPFTTLINPEEKLWYDNELLINNRPDVSYRAIWLAQNIGNLQESSMYKIDHLNNLWEASVNGLKKFDGNTWSGYFPDHTFYSICFDNQNNIYATTLPQMEEQGVILRYNYKNWDTIFVCPTAHWVPCMHFDTENNLWFGVLSRWSVGIDAGNGLYKFDGNKFTNYNVQNSKLPSNSVIEIAIDHNNNKWIGTYTGGLAKLDTDNNWKIFDKENTPMPFNSIEHILVDSDKNIWFAIQYHGLARLKE